jgi:hypothetical protein
MIHLIVVKQLLLYKQIGQLSFVQVTFQVAKILVKVTQVEGFTRLVQQ